MGFRRDDHDVRDALHDGGRLYALEEQSVRGDVLYGFFPPRCRRPRPDLLFRFLLPGMHRPPSGPGPSMPANPGRSTSTRASPSNGPPVYPFKTVIPLAGAPMLIQGIVEIIRCIRCLKDGSGPRAHRGRSGSRRGKIEGGWTSRTRTSPSSTSLSTARKGQTRHEERTLFRTFDFGGDLHPELRADASAVADHERPPRPPDAGADRGGDHARFPHGIHADGHGHVLHWLRLRSVDPSTAVAAAHSTCLSSAPMG